MARGIVGVMLSAADILVSLQKSDRWGTNCQPEDMSSFAQLLSTLPCISVRMKNRATCIIEFSRELTVVEVKVFRAGANLEDDDEDPFDPGVRTRAFLWWDQRGGYRAHVVTGAMVEDQLIPVLFRNHRCPEME